MIGILVMTHGNLSEGLIQSCELIAGKSEKVIGLKLNREDNIEDLVLEMDQALTKLDDGDGVLVLTDLLGGSPCNVASIGLKKGKEYQLLTGVNSPMLLEAMISRNTCDLKELSAKCLTTASEGVKLVNEIL